MNVPASGDQNIAGRAPVTYCQVQATGVFVGVCLLIHAALLSWAAFHQSPNDDEPGHLAAGVYTWYTHRFDVYCVNPPLVRTLASVPVALCQRKTKALPYRNESGTRLEWWLGSALMQGQGGKTPLRYFFLGRCTLIPFCLLGAWLCWHWASRLYGRLPGIVAIGLWCFSPTMVASGSIVCNESVAAAFGLAAVYTYWLWLRRPNLTHTIIAGLTLGVAQLCKFTLLILLPVLPLLWIAYRFAEWRTVRPLDLLRQGGMLVGILLVTIDVINCGYLFEDAFKPLESFRFHTMLFTGYNSLPEIPADGANRFDGTLLGKLPVPLPANMVQGIDTQRLDFERGMSSYLCGVWSDHGWWYYYLYALTIKTPLGTLFLVILAIALTVLGVNDSASRRDQMVVLVPFGAILGFVSSQTGFSVHSRYVVPALPFMFVWMSKVARVFEMPPRTPLLYRNGPKGVASWLRGRRRVALSATVVTALAWSTGSTLSIYPHCLSYFNELTALLPTPADSLYPKPIDENGGYRSVLPQLSCTLASGPCRGPRHLVNSNIDWGQDLLYLKGWLGEHPEVHLDGMAYWGACPPVLAGILETPEPRPGMMDWQYHPDQPDSTARGDLGGNQLGPNPGWYALSVNRIYERSGVYRYFLNYKPVAMAGYSIYIYHITPKGANQVRRTLGMAELPEQAKSNDDPEVHSTLDRARGERRLP